MNDETNDWASITDALPAEASNGDRLPFFAWRDVPADTDVRITVVSSPRTENLVSGFAIFEFDGNLHGQGKTATSYLFSVSGTRLARAIGRVAPKVGDSIVLRCRGEGKEREWTCRKA